MKQKVGESCSGRRKMSCRGHKSWVGKAGPRVLGIGGGNSGGVKSSRAAPRTGWQEVARQSVEIALEVLNDGDDGDDDDDDAE
jgi:hypothetical protein